MGMELIPYDESECGIAAAVAQQCVDLAKPGHVFTGAWLEEVLGLGEKPEQTTEYEQWTAKRARLFGAWKGELLSEYRIHVEDRLPRGYVVIAPDQTPFVAVRVAAGAFRRAMQQASDKIQYAPPGLTNRQRQDRLDALAYLGKIELAVKHGRPKPPRPERSRPEQIAG